MESTTQDASGATDQIVSDENQIDNSNNTDNSSGDVVAYQTHKRLLSQKKKIEQDHQMAMEELNKLREHKLTTEGKKDELIEAYKKRIGDLEGKVNDFAYTTVANSVRLKAKEMGCVDDSALVKHIDLSSLSIGDGFTVDEDELRTLLEQEKKSKPYFFKPLNPNVNNSVPNTNPNVQGGKVDFSKMTKEEMLTYAKANGLE